MLSLPFQGVSESFYAGQGFGQYRNLKMLKGEDLFDSFICLFTPNQVRNIAQLTTMLKSKTILSNSRNPLLLLSRDVVVAGHQTECCPALSIPPLPNPLVLPPSPIFSPNFATNMLMFSSMLPSSLGLSIPLDSCYYSHPTFNL